MKTKTNFIISIVAILLMTATSCSREKKDVIEPRHQKEIKKEVVEKKPVIQKQDEKIIFEAGESLASKFPKTWPRKAKELGIPLYKSKWGNKTDMLLNGVYYYTYIFPGDYILGKKIYDKYGKNVDFDARIKWHNNH